MKLKIKLYLLFIAPDKHNNNNNNNNNNDDDDDDTLNRQSIIFLYTFRSIIRSNKYPK